MTHRVLATALLCAAPCLAFQIPPPHVVGEVFDGAPVDLCASGQRVWIAEGRNVAVLDAVSGARLGVDASSPYPTTVQAVEHDPVLSTRIVATRRALDVVWPSGAHARWDAPAGSPDLQDVKTIPGSRVVVAAAGKELVVLDVSSGAIVEIARAACPIADVNLFRRVQVREVDGRVLAFAIAALDSPVLPRKSSLVIADLDREHGYAQPLFFAQDWRAHVAYGDPFAGSRAVEVFPDLWGTQDVAFVADITGMLTELDVSDPAHPTPIARVFPDGACGPAGAVYNLASDPTRGRLFVAGANRLYVYQLPAMNLLGCTQVDFVDAGRRDMALVRRRDGTRVLWTATPHSVDWVLNQIDVATPQPTVLRRDWWIASSDGAVAVPEWSSVYLPTLGGIARYDVSDEAHPRPIAGSYRPAGAFTEHVEVVFPSTAAPDRGLLLTATGAGGVQTWPISSAHRDPGVPELHRATPPAWASGDLVYGNDAEPLVRNGRAYALCDLSDLTTGTVALQAFDLATGQSTNCFASSSALHPNTSDVCVAGDFAVVACNGGVFVVKLADLPNALTVVAQKLVDLDFDGHGESVGSVASNPAGTVLYVATDSIAGVASYAMDPQTGALSGPLCSLHGAQFPGCVGRIRYYAPTARLYVASRASTLIELYAGAPASLQVLSIWRDDGQQSELQDAHVYDFGNGPRVLAVKNAEGFAILDPDDGL